MMSWTSFVQIAIPVLFVWYVIRSIFGYLDRTSFTRTDQKHKRK